MTTVAANRRVFSDLNPYRSGREKSGNQKPAHAPGFEAAPEMADVAKAGCVQAGPGLGRTLAAAGIQDQKPIPGERGKAPGQRRQWPVDGARQVPAREFVRLAHVDDQRGAIGFLEHLVQLRDLDFRMDSHVLP